MGSLAGGLLSYKELRKGRKALKKQEEEQKRAEARAEALKPAGSVSADGVVRAASDDMKRRRGVQSTFLSSWTGTGVDEGEGVGA